MELRFLHLFIILQRYEREVNKNVRFVLKIVAFALVFCSNNVIYLSQNHRR